MGRWPVRNAPGWYLQIVEEPEEEPLDLAYVRDQHLRGVNGTAEDARIAALIRTARRQGEAFTGRAWMPQTWALVGASFSGAAMDVPLPPLIGVLAVEYVDSVGAIVVVDPADYYVTAPSGPMATHGTIRPVSAWPTAATRPDAVRITFRAGYEDTSSPPAPNVPEDLLDGALLVIGELYKQRTLSVQGFGVGQSPALLSAEALWSRYRVDVVVA
jgi:uncharacterized phiE125 gp8 family phage protein